ncbi:hypothetical protein AUK10_02925 [Candidatus Gracilibacteria bacterium CG2_30_37_12]|nr:MAG: hypothetical protein AUK10_02925 [Candidatus Gracilibacteria bacterium CG2_30_37_12]
MFKVYFSTESSAHLAHYIIQYREYYENLYRDSGIWSEDQIIDGYIAESKQRKNEIMKLITTRLSQEMILGKTSLNAIVLPWRSKYIFLEWAEDDDLQERRISKFDIR